MSEHGRHLTQLRQDIQVRAGTCNLRYFRCARLAFDAIAKSRTGLTLFLEDLCEPCSRIFSSGIMNVTS
jgi:hypothetical protein